MIAVACDRGTTSACAENTFNKPGFLWKVWNYLRVRGEYAIVCTPVAPPRELPPRARRIQFAWWWRNCLVGTTSACAENTGHDLCPPPHIGNYLRVRGEYHVSMKPLIASRELPPRARRIHLGGKEIVGDGVNYLRVRGEYSPATSPAHCSAELPPRARRIPEPSATSSTPAGTTSACAENTHDGHGRVPCKWNYLRVRGEYHCLGFLGGAN